MAAPCEQRQSLREQHGTVSGGVRLGIRKRLFPKRMARYWNKLPQGCGHSTRPDRVREAFGKHKACGVILGDVLCRTKIWT